MGLEDLGGSSKPARSPKGHPDYPPIDRRVRALWVAGRGLGDLLQTRSPKPELASRGEEAALYRKYRDANLGDQGLEDLPSRVS